MLLEFWKNPEFIRHVRAELRPTRMAVIASVVTTICATAGIFCWAVAEGDRRVFLGTFYGTLLCAQGVVLFLWWSSSCTEAIAGERAMKTYDFLRTTRLTADELVIGKLTGAPAVALFAFLCSLPVSIVAGLLFGISPPTLIATYLLLAIYAPLFGLFALVISMSLEKPVRGMGFSGFGMLYVLTGVSLVSGEGPFPALASLSIGPALLQLYGLFGRFDLQPVVPLVFGVPANLLLITPLVLASLAGWLFLMVRRNIKKEVEEISLLSRWQAIGFAVYLNFLFYAFLDSSRLLKFLDRPRGEFVADHPGTEPITGFVIMCMLVLNGLILFAGSSAAAVTPREPLKIWRRRFKAGEASYLAENGLPWPWLAMAAVIAYAMFVLYALAWRSKIPLEKWELGWVATQLVFLLVFAIRDVLFLQICKLTKMKNAVSKGAGLLMLHYITVVVIMVAVHSVSERFDELLLSLFTPFAPLLPQVHLAFPIVGIALQVVLCVLLLRTITRRLDRPVTAPVIAE